MEWWGAGRRISTMRGLGDPRGNPRRVAWNLQLPCNEGARTLEGRLRASAGMQGSIPGKAFFIQVGGWSAYARRLFGFRRGMESIHGNGFCVRGKDEEHSRERFLRSCEGWGAFVGRVFAFVRRVFALGQRSWKRLRVRNFGICGCEFEGEEWWGRDDPTPQ